MIRVGTVRNRMVWNAMTEMFVILGYEVTRVDFDRNPYQRVDFLDVQLEAPETAYPPDLRTLEMNVRMLLERAFGFGNEGTFRFTDLEDASIQCTVRLRGAPDIEVNL